MCRCFISCLDSPQPLIGKSPPGPCLQVFFGREGVGRIFESHIGHQRPRFVFRRVLGAAVIMMLYAFIDIVGDADVALIGEGETADQVDVFHGVLN